MNASMFNSAVMRSFGGMERADMRVIVAETFMKHCGQILRELVANEPRAAAEVLLSAAPPLELIKENLKDLPSETGPGGRHLMVLSYNESALEMMVDEGLLTPENSEFILGSSFPDDNSRDRVYHNVNRIKECMKTGRRVVLLHLDELYESLYDLLNQ